MLKEERHKYILDQVHLHHRVLLNDLSESLNVSIDTVRRDVKRTPSGQKIGKKSMEEPPLLGLWTSPKMMGNIYLQSKKISNCWKDCFLTFRRTGESWWAVVRLIWKWRNWFLKSYPWPYLHPAFHVAMALLEHKDVEGDFLGGKANFMRPNLR